MPYASIFRSLIGFLLFAGIAWCFSENRSRFPWRIVLIGMAAQVVIAVVLLKFPLFTGLFSCLNRGVLALQESSTAGTSFVFGYLGGGEAPFAVTRPQAMFVLAFQALPLVLLISALSSVLFYWNILPKIVKGFSWLLERGMRVGGAEGLSVAANIFVGMVEAPLLIRPYLGRMTRSELFTVMTSGMAGIAGTVMILYATILNRVIPNVIGHILIASIISAPASVVIAKIMVPETGAKTSGDLEIEDGPGSAMDALTRGTVQGMELLLNIIGMIIVLVAVVHLINLTLGLIPDVSGAPLTLQRMFGWVMAPVVWIMGIPWEESRVAGSLFGTKTVLNEFIAYLDMSNLPPGTLSHRSLLIMSYAMCGFANPGSLGIMIGGMGAMAPERRPEIVSLGFRSIVSGTLSTCMIGAVVGLLYVP